MKAIILAAGYATRLYPLTLHKSKALLPINNKPMIDYIIEKMNDIDILDEIYVVSNHLFYNQFIEWAKQIKTDKRITILDDGTTSDENKIGAIGDISFAIKEKNIDDELLIVAGDNFFTYSLQEYLDFFHEKDCDCVCVKEWLDKESLSQFGIALLDENSLVLDIEEKPELPKSNNVVFATYFYKRETVPLFQQYLDQGNKPDAPGNFPAWLYKQQKVYAYAFSGDCYDIGTPKSYEEVCKLFIKS